jgi:hypothetical protein
VAGGELFGLNILGCRAFLVKIPKLRLGRANRDKNSGK